MSLFKKKKPEPEPKKHRVAGVIVRINQGQVGSSNERRYYLIKVAKDTGWGENQDTVRFEHDFDRHNGSRDYSREGDTVFLTVELTDTGAIKSVWDLGIDISKVTAPPEELAEEA